MVKVQCLCDVAIKINSSTDSINVLVANMKPPYWALWSSMAASNQAHFFVVNLRSKVHYQRGHTAQYSGFKLAASTFVLSILEY